MDETRWLNEDEFEKYWVEGDFEKFYRDIGHDDRAIDTRKQNMKCGFLVGWNRGQQNAWDARERGEEFIPMYVKGKEPA